MSIEVPIPGNLSLRNLDVVIENQEQWYGSLTGLKTDGEFTMGVFEQPYPPVNTLMLALTIGGQAPPINANQAELLFTGEAYVLSQKMGVAAYRLKSDG